MTGVTGTVLGYGLAVPGARTAADLLTMSVGEHPAVDPAALIGRKGLRYKDRATQLALCAAGDALTDAGLTGGEDGTGVPGDDIAVVVSSNLGNVDTVCRVTSEIAAGGSVAVSAMDIPNASSNVTAAEVAIRYGLRGPNLTFCNGGTSGLDAIYWALVLLATGRAQRALVIGVEPDNAQARALTGHDRILDGAAAVVLGRPGAGGRARVSLPVRAPDTASCAAQLDAHGTPGVWFPPERSTMVGPLVFDLWSAHGAASGAAGVMQCVAALGWLETARPGPVYAMVSGAEASAAVAVAR
jgi:3-oxoacyl-[acyl-carrier-protein] synthase II